MLHHKSWRWYRRHLPLGVVVFVAVLAIVLPTWLSESQILPFHREDVVVPSKPPWPVVIETAFDTPPLSLPHLNKVHVRDTLNVPVPQVSLDTLAWVVHITSINDTRILPAWRDRLKVSGWDAYVQPEKSQGDQLYIGPFSSKDAAVAAAANIQKQYHLKSTVINYNIPQAHF